VLPVVVPATLLGVVYAARQSCSGAFTIAGHDDEEGYLSCGAVWYLHTSASRARAAVPRTEARRALDCVGLTTEMNMQT